MTGLYFRLASWSCLSGSWAFVAFRGSVLVSTRDRASREPVVEELVEVYLPFF